MKLTSGNIEEAYNQAGIAGDWHGKLDPHEAGYIAGTLGRIIKGVESAETIQKAETYLLDEISNELPRMGEMHRLVIKAICSLASALGIEDFVEKIGNKKLNEFTNYDKKMTWRQFLTSGEGKRNGVWREGD